MRVTVPPSGVLRPCWHFATWGYAPFTFDNSGTSVRSLPIANCRHVGQDRSSPQEVFVARLMARTGLARAESMPLTDEMADAMFTLRNTRKAVVGLIGLAA